MILLGFALRGPLAWAQTAAPSEPAAVTPAAIATPAVVDPSAVRAMQVGDKWVYRFHDIGNRREPVEMVNQVIRVQGSDAWMYGTDTVPNATYPEFIWRWDQKRAKAAERFNIDLSQRHGVGSRTANFQPEDDTIQLPLIPGKAYKVKFDWTNGAGYTELTLKVGELKPVKVAAGEFMAYEIVGKGWWNNTSAAISGRAENVYWWSPQVGRFIKRTTQDWNPRGSLWNNSSWELIHWQPQVALVKDIAAMAEAEQAKPKASPPAAQ
jgi:hypothetical protein